MMNIKSLYISFQDRISSSEEREGIGEPAAIFNIRAEKCTDVP
uniref:Uncharacterized protein n=1 Tax=Anguilla anguilla TaxID=7936 RepID=A0A0E9UFW5_ANGAN